MCDIMYMCLCIYDLMLMMRYIMFFMDAFIVHLYFTGTPNKTVHFKSDIYSIRIQYSTYSTLEIL